MATGGLNVIENNLAYFGAAKQSAWGTAVTTPTWYHRWLDGSALIEGAQQTSQRVGDTSPAVSLSWKTGQYWGFKVVEYMWPQSLGYVLAALLGTNSDTYTAPTKSTTLSGASNTAGASSLVLVGDLGNTGTLALNVNPGYASTTYEVVSIDATTRSGSGPYTYTIAASGTLKYTHSAGETVNNLSQHVFTRQPTTFNPCTYEVGFGTSSNTTKQAIRLTDAVCTDLTISGQKGQLWQLQHNWIARTGTLLTSVQSITSASFEGGNKVGVAGGPFVWWQGSNWQINGSSSNNAATIENFQIQIKNSTAWDDMQSEVLTPAYFLPGNIDISGSMTVELVSFAQYNDMYFGSPSAANNSTDSNLVGYESIDITCASDAVNSFEITLPQVYYTAAKMESKLDGKAMRQPLSFTATAPSTLSAPLTLTLKNSASAQY